MKIRRSEEAEYFACKHENTSIKVYGVSESDEQFCLLIVPGRA